MAASAQVVLPTSGFLLGAGDVPASGSLAMRFRLFASATGGAAVWTGDASGAPCSVAANAGYYAIVLGEACGPSLAGSGVDTGEARWLEVEVGGVVLVPRFAIAVPPASRDAQLLRSALATPGTLNDAGNPVEWSRLKGVTAGAGLTIASGTLGIAPQAITPSFIGSSGQPATRVLLADGLGGAAWGQVTNAQLATGTITPDRLSGYSAGTGLVTGLNAERVGGLTAGELVAQAQAGGASLALLAGITRPCNGGSGTQVFDGASWGACVSSSWNCVANTGHAGCVSSSQYATCGDIRNDPNFAGTSASYWIDPDGASGAAPFQVWCDMVLDGGGWMVVAWANTSSKAWADGTQLSTLKGATAHVIPSVAAFASYIDNIPMTFGSSRTWNTRVTYRNALQATLDIGPGTARAYTGASTWNGTLVATNLLPASARETTNLNCGNISMIDYAGTLTSLNKGCFIEVTTRHSGTWAGCGQGAYDGTGGAAWNLCFDNGNSTASVGNSALGIWHHGAPTYHEIWGVNYGTNNPANGTWGSAGGNWTWSAWIR